MRVTVLVHYYPPEIAAAARRLDGLVSRWTELGAAVTVVCPVSHYPRGTRLPEAAGQRSWVGADGPHGERVVRVPFLRTGSAGAGKLADQIVSAVGSSLPAAGRPADVVVGSLPGLPTLLPVWTTHLARRAPVVLDMRDSWPDLIEEAELGPAWVRRPLSRFTTALQRRAAGVVTVSQGFADILAARGVRADRLQVIRNGVDLSLVPLLPPRAPGGALRVLYLGNHGVSQGLDTVVRALAALDRTIEARFVGDGSERDALRRLAGELRAPISFEAPVRGEELWRAYGWADTCLVPLRPWPSFRDAVPSKIYEIMACGRHVTAQLEGEAADVLAEAGAGLAVPPGEPEALAEALRSLALHRERLLVGEEPRRWVHGHATYEALGRRYFEFLQSVTDGAGQRR
jgi:glycosyltransferase involved in cell wall biosynthesis